MDLDAWIISYSWIAKPKFSKIGYQAFFFSSFVTKSMVTVLAILWISATEITNSSTFSDVSKASHPPSIRLTSSLEKVFVFLLGLGADLWRSLQSSQIEENFEEDLTVQVRDKQCLP